MADSIQNIVLSRMSDWLLVGRRVSAKKFEFINEQAPLQGDECFPGGKTEETFTRALLHHGLRLHQQGVPVFEQYVHYCVLCVLFVPR